MTRQPPRGGVGSNQYVSRPGNSAAADRASTSAVAQALTEEDINEMGWAFAPDSDGAWAWAVGTDTWLIAKGRALGMNALEAKERLVPVSDFIWSDFDVEEAHAWNSLGVTASVATRLKGRGWPNPKDARHLIEAGVSPEAAALAGATPGGPLEDAPCLPREVPLPDDMTDGQVADMYAAAWVNPAFTVAALAHQRQRPRSDAVTTVLQYLPDLDETERWGHFRRVLGRDGWTTTEIAVAVADAAPDRMMAAVNPEYCEAQPTYEQVTAAAKDAGVLIRQFAPYTTMEELVEAGRSVGWTVDHPRDGNGDVTVWLVADAAFPHQGEAIVEAIAAGDVYRRDQLLADLRSWGRSSGHPTV